MIKLLVVIIILIIAIIWIYNLLVKERNQELAAWGYIDVQLKRRYELIPQLVSTASVDPTITSLSTGGGFSGGGGGGGGW